MIHVSSDQGAVFESQMGAVGFVIISDVALAAGVTSIPGPFSELNDDGWFVWVPFLLEGTIGLSGQVGQTFEFDSKAMRRIEEGFSIAVVLENSATSFGLKMTIAFSQLSSLS